MRTGHPIVDAMTPMHFQGTIIDHRWIGHLWLCKKTEKGKIIFFRDAAYVLAEICYFHQARVEKDPEGHIVSVTKRFDGQEMYQDYELWYQKLGFPNKRALQDVISFLANPNELRKFALIKNDTKPVRLRGGGLTNNMPHLTPIPKYILEMTFGGGLTKFGDTPPERVQEVVKEGEEPGGVPELGETSNENTGDSVPELGETPNENPGDNNSNNSSSVPSKNIQHSSEPFVEFIEEVESQDVALLNSNAVALETETEDENWEEEEEWDAYRNRLASVVADLSLHVSQEVGLALVRHFTIEVVEGALDEPGKIAKMARELPADAVVEMAEPEAGAPARKVPVPAPLPATEPTLEASPQVAPDALAVVTPGQPPADLVPADGANFYLNPNVDPGRVLAQMVALGVDSSYAASVLQKEGAPYCDHYVRVLGARNPETPHKLLVSCLKKDYDKIRGAASRLFKEDAMALAKRNAAQVEQRRERDRVEQRRLEDLRLAAENAELDRIYEGYPPEAQARYDKEAKATLGPLAQRDASEEQLIEARRNVMRRMLAQVQAGNARTGTGA